jgi:hypothetical protein
VKDILEIQTILDSCKKILCNPKLYKEQNFFDVPHHKISLAVIKSLTNKSYATIGKHFKRSWYSIYSSCKDVNKNGLKNFTSNIIELVKKDLKN